MSESNAIISGHAAALRIENLDTDQIMPKQFLRGIDKAGLAQGLLYDLRFDSNGKPRPDCVLNRTGNSTPPILIGGSNFGCGSSREHAVWGLQQFGIRAVIASSYGEIFYSNAMNNRLMLVMLPVDQVEALMRQTEADPTTELNIDVGNLRVHGPGFSAPFTLSPRHQQMFLENLDVIGLTLKRQADIERFSQQHWQQFPWMKDVASNSVKRLAAFRV